MPEVITATVVVDASEGQVTALNRVTGWRRPAAPLAASSRLRGHGL